MLINQLRTVEGILSLVLHKPDPNMLLKYGVPGNEIRYETRRWPQCHLDDAFALKESGQTQDDRFVAVSCSSPEECLRKTPDVQLVQFRFNSPTRISSGARSPYSSPSNGFPVKLSSRGQAGGALKISSLAWNSSSSLTFSNHYVAKPIL